MPLPDSYEGELASSILLEDGDGGQADALSSPGDRSLLSGSPLFGGGFGGIGNSSAGASSGRRGLPPHTRADGQAPNRTPTRTPSPVYQYGGGANKGFGDSPESLPSFQAPERKSSSSTTAAAAGPSTQPQGDASSSANSLFPGSGGPMTGFPPMFPGVPGVPPLWPGGLNPAAYYGMMMNNPLLGPQAAAAVASVGQAAGAPPGQGVPPVDPNMIQMMMALQAQQASGAQTAPSFSSANAPPPSSPQPTPAPGGESEVAELEIRAPASAGLPSASQALAPGPQPQRSAGSNAALAAPTPAPGDGRKSKSRKDKEGAAGRQQQQPQQHEPGAIVSSSSTVVPSTTGKGSGMEKGGKGDRRRRGGGGSDAPMQATSEERSQGKSRVETRSPLIEQLKARERNVDLTELAAHISEIAQDQYGSRLIQQKLEVATEEQKQQAFKQVLIKMPQLTIDVFGNYVIQKFFEYGSAEQRRILAEQLVGQVLKLSLQMYGCRVVQKALDSVPIEQQVLLIGELKGHVIKCIEDQHGNHVIQKCIERLPTDRIGFIVDSFLGQTARLAKHCYGCRVIQRLIEYCASVQISALLDEVLRNCMELATDQYGNYVVQHVMEHSSRPGDRQQVMGIVRKNILSLSCHKFASNIIEKALQCATMEERVHLVEAITGQQGDPHPPLLVMMRDRFGNYIVQRVISLAQGPQRDVLFWKLREHMAVLKKSNTYGKHIISAMERAQSGAKD
eukprot:TRINITY_DN28792_c0_g1_i1.p1 TRINITY_DN28792_c0_g1~~TRINITY_DN28792_c0_g1_i1.p1  ORF type:complete len:733 (-),score=164.70 TRINITY_DN28792_c0_g1_i1:73-2271(-)